MSKNELLLPEDVLTRVARGSIVCIDVRAPIEFAQGHVPGAVNLPILNDEERALVGTTYKQEGNEAATRLGHKLVSGIAKATRVDAWCEFVNKNPHAFIYCFRGGQRSTIAQKWMQEAGVEIPRVDGGYKALRQGFLYELKQISQDRKFLVVCGFTGNGKTILIEEATDFYPNINLESLARHRGSAFGGFNDPQPSQANFENLLACDVIRRQGASSNSPTHRQVGRALLIEDESRMIGKCELPADIFAAVQSSPSILINEPIATRVENIFTEYILNSAIGADLKSTNCQNSADIEPALLVFASFKNSLRAISKKLGGAKTAEILALVEFSESRFRSSRELDSNRAWIEMLLTSYYDPLYLRGLQRRETKPVFQGTRRECLQFLRQI